MQVFASGRTQLLWTVLVVFLVLSGCRTYGGYGTEEEVYDQIVKTNERFADALARARADLAALDRAAGGSPLLMASAQQYREVVAAHEAILDEHQQMAAALAGEDDYRQLNRAYGAIVSGERLIRDQYDALRDQLFLTTREQLTVRDEVPKDRYYVAPPFYERIRYANQRSQRTVNDILGGGQGMRRDAAVPDEALEGQEAQEERENEAASVQ